jgi:hypothetical protein
LFLIDPQRQSLLEASLHKVESSEFATIQAILEEYLQHQALKAKRAYHRLVFLP